MDRGRGLDIIIEEVIRGYASKKILKPFDHPFGRTGAGSGEWAEDFKGNSLKPTGNGE